MLLVKFLFSLKSKEEFSFLQEECETLIDNQIHIFNNNNNTNIYEKKIDGNCSIYSQKTSFLAIEKPERLSLKDKLEKSRKFINTPSKYKENC